jgi:hypothetical protein
MHCHPFSFVFPRIPINTRLVPVRTWVYGTYMLKLFIVIKVQIFHTIYISDTKHVVNEELK